MRTAWNAWKVSVRRACGVLRLDPKTYRYRSRRPGQALLESRIKEICQTRVRYGYRRVHVMLRREGWVINEKRTRRVYNEMGMQLRSKTPRRRVKAALRADRTPPSGSNEVWAMDFVHDLRAGVPGVIWHHRSLLRRLLAPHQLRATGGGLGAGLYVAGTDSVRAENASVVVTFAVSGDPRE